jgi:hypothetical protein
MSTSNGMKVIKIGRKGMRLFQLEGATQPVEVDVVYVMERFWDLDRSFRNDKDEIPDERQEEYRQASYAFVASLLGATSESKLTFAEATHFLNLLRDEYDALRVFFARKSPDVPSSPPPTTVTYSA